MIKRTLWALWIFTIFIVVPPVMVWFYWLCVHLESISLNPLTWESDARACLFWWGVSVAFGLVGLITQPYGFNDDGRGAP